MEGIEMLRRSIKVLAAAAVLGISPALLTAQAPLEDAGAQLGSQSKAAGQVTNPAPKVPGKNARIDANSELDSKSQLNNRQLDAKSKLDAKSQLESDSPLKSMNESDAGVDAKVKGTTPDLQTPPQTPDAADGAIQSTPGNVELRGRVQGDADLDVDGNQPLRHQTNRPQTFDNQTNADIDDFVRQGTAHLDIDDATRARYRHHNGHWWYKTEQGAWLIHTNGQWEPFDPVTYRSPGQPADQDYYQDDDNYQSSNYYDDGSYYQGGTYYDPGYSGYGRNYYRGNRYRNNFNDGRGYGRGYYNNRGNRYNGNWGSGYRGLNRDQRQGAAIGAGIGGAIGGNRGAAIGAGIGAGVAD
jgi:hypothetical protein|tara:strand:- start:55 stop:1119 length:1065 start_codon:yes stop_codon:yes gene_type:complete